MIFDLRDSEGNLLCLPCTPGGENASLVVRGNKVAKVKEVVFLVERTALMGVGLFLVGFRGDKLLRGTLAAGATVELFVLGYSYCRNLQQKRQAAAQQPISEEVEVENAPNLDAGESQEFL